MRYCHIQYINMTGTGELVACRKTWNAGGLNMAVPGSIYKTGHI